MLRKDSSRIVLPADKGKTIVIPDIADYKNKGATAVD